MTLELILAIVIVVVITLIFYILIIHKGKKQARLKRLLEISNGTFDNPAQAALETLNAQTELTPAQHAVRGNIIRYNILENPHTVPRAAPERRQFGRMVRDYDQAVRGAGTYFARGGGAAVAGIHDHGGDVGGGFGAAGGVGDIAGGDVLTAGNIIRVAMTLTDLFGPAAHNPLEEDFDIFQMMMMLNTTVMENVPIIQQGLTEQRVQAAAVGAENRAEVIAKALAPTYTDDRQNVHDTKINSDLNEILRKIEPRDGRLSVDTEIESARGYIRSHRNGIKRQRAEEALSVMAQAGHMSTYGDNEARIFALTWKRCSDPRNAASADVMREAVVDALADCFDGEPPHLVCANGRCSRVINSLALVDYDPGICGAMTFEAYKNLIMREANEIFENAIAEAADGGESERQVARSYTDPSVTPDPEAEREFKNKLRDSVDRMLDNYGDKFNARELEQLREETYTYVTL